MDGERLIFHVDVNSAFLSWSAVKRLEEDPSSVDLRTIPSAVGGDVATRHGIITAKSIPAKQYGIQTGEPVVKALAKCPNLVLVPSDFTSYREYSRRFIVILKEHTDAVEQVSIDEAFLDLTELLPEDEDLRQFAPRMAAAIKDEIKEKLHFTVNVGISTNKLLAKTASDFSKPDKIHTLYPEEVPDKFWPLPIGELFGCGKKTAARLISLGIKTIGEAAHTDVAILRSVLGEAAGTYVHNSANGIGSVTVSTVREKAKSYSHELTTQEDITAQNYEEQALPIVKQLAAGVSRRLKRDGVKGFTVDVSVKTGGFKRRSRQRRLTKSTDDAAVIEENACSLLRSLLYDKGGLFEAGQSIRLIGVGVSGMDDGSYEQEDLFGWMETMKNREKERPEPAAKETGRTEEYR